MTPMTVIAERSPWEPTLGIAAFFTNEQGKHYMAMPITMHEVEEGVQTQPFVRLRPAEAQQLVDSLWRCGIRPTEAAGSAGSMAATEKHLEDMRKIVFGTLELKP